MTKDPTPAEALAAIRDARGSVVEQMNKAHWSLDVLYGASCAGIVAGAGLPSPIGMTVTAVSICGLAVMVRVWQKQTGVWISGLSPKRARWVSISLGVLLVGLLIASLASGRMVGHWWPSIVFGLVAGVGSVVASRVWMRVYRRELAEEGA